MTRTSWPRSSAASLRRFVEYRLAFRDRRAIFIACGRYAAPEAAWRLPPVRYDRPGSTSRRPAIAGAAEQHPEAHLVAVGEGQLDRERGRRR